MIDNFDDSSFNLLINEFEKGFISHAYLIDENNNNFAFDMVKTLVKKIFCLDSSESEKDKICKRIDDNNYPELKVIEPDGMLIKKQQIIDLQREFSMEAVEGNRRIYIIRDCEKMRPETANSMLKFLEEPENNIIAFLMTNNINGVLDTIISRCQIIKLNGNNNLVNDEFDLLALEFIDNIEKKGGKSIIDNEKLLMEIINSKDKEKMILFVDKLIDMYYSIMKLIDEEEKGNILYYDKLIKYVKNNSVNKIINKINCLIECKESIKYNVNINLLIDKLILSIGG